MAKKNIQQPRGDILVIEDNSVMAGLLVEKLGHQGLKAVSVSDGKSSLEIIAKNKPTLVLLGMPLSGVVDGFETLRQIRQIYDQTSLPVIVLFNVHDKIGIKTVVDSGANTYLVSSNADKIIASVREAYENKGMVTPQETASISPEPTGATTKYGKTMPAVLESHGVPSEVPKKLKTKIEEALKLPEAEISIINLIDSLLEYAFLARASDIHMEPFEDRLAIRLRIDGILHDLFDFPKGVHSGVISRIKVLGGMRTDEHQAAQDGRFKTTLTEQKREFDVRISIIPTYYGENAVLRLLAEQTQISKLDDLALTEINRVKIRSAVGKPFGMILATGPTGSGKTTTLYTILKELNTREVQIITIEDPIEYSLEGVDQIQVNSRTGLTFAAGLRSILRQDPNIIMVGEIRDEETASIAVNAALTGHKLLSTLHTNDAATTLPRLLDMGVEPFLVASTVNIAIGQRLARMICQNCKTRKRITNAEFQQLSEHLSLAMLDDHRDFYYGKGCDVCGDTGYFSRMGIYEILEMNDFIREAIMRGADASEIKKIAIKNGMATLLEDGFQKALDGLTTIEEILRVVHE